MTAASTPSWNDGADLKRLLQQIEGKKAKILERQKELEREKDERMKG